MALPEFSFCMVHTLFWNTFFNSDITVSTNGSISLFLLFLLFFHFFPSTPIFVFFSLPVAQAIQCWYIYRPPHREFLYRRPVKPNPALLTFNSTPPPLVCALHSKYLMATHTWMPPWENIQKNSFTHSQSTFKYVLENRAWVRGLTRLPFQLAGLGRVAVTDEGKRQRSPQPPPPPLPAP